MDTDQARTLAKLFASKFIIRPDIRAIQTPDGEYRPQRDPKTNWQPGFDMPALLDHLGGVHTYGHYLVSPENQVKFFVLDIDLEKTGLLPQAKFGTEYLTWSEVPLRDYWASRQPGPGREIIKLQFKMLANKLARNVTELLGIPVAVAYSGSKGVHVYGFTGTVPAEYARKGASIVLESCGFAPTRGNNFFKLEKTIDYDDKIYDYKNLSVEVYPKQDHLDSDQLGNLIRLPLGRNLKSPKDKCFFVDMRTALMDFSPMDPVEALTTDNIWRYPGE